MAPDPGSVTALLPFRIIKAAALPGDGEAYVIESYINVQPMACTGNVDDGMCDNLKTMMINHWSG